MENVIAALFLVSVSPLNLNVGRVSRFSKYPSLEMQISEPNWDWELFSIYLIDSYEKAHNELNLLAVRKRELLC